MLATTLLFPFLLHKFSLRCWNSSNAFFSNYLFVLDLCIVTSVCGTCLSNYFLCCACLVLLTFSILFFDDECYAKKQTVSDGLTANHNIHQITTGVFITRISPIQRRIARYWKKKKTVVGFLCKSHTN